MVFCYGKCIIFKVGDFAFSFFVCLFVFVFLFPRELQQGEKISFSLKNQSEFLLCKTMQILQSNNANCYRVTILQSVCTEDNLCFFAHNMCYLVVVPYSNGNSVNVLLCAIN